MEEELLLKKGEGQDIILTWCVFGEEVKRLGGIAGPMIAVNLTFYLIEVVSTMMVGHLGELSLSSTAVAISLADITGFSFMFGMSCALETLCGQANGARQYKKVATHTHTAIFSLFIFCLPISLLWINMSKILIFLGQDHLISTETGNFLMCLIPALFANPIIQPLIRYYLSQSLIFPMAIFSCTTLALHVPLCWVLVFKSGLGNLGGAVAMGISYWFFGILLLLYMNYSLACESTRFPFSVVKAYQGVGEFFRLAVPSAVMICVQWWSYEVLILLSGLLPNPEFESSILSVCYSTVSTLYTLPDGFSAAARVSNELGAGNPKRARIVAFSVLFMALVEAIITSTTLFALRRVFGYSFSSDKEVVDFVTKMVPLLCFGIIIDCLQGVLSGIVRGCGWQHLGAYANIVSIYLFGIPFALIFGFFFKLRAEGLWIGNQLGALLQSILLSLIIGGTDWKKQAIHSLPQLI